MAIHGRTLLLLITICAALSTALNACTVSESSLKSNSVSSIEPAKEKSDQPLEETGEGSTSPAEGQKLNDRYRKAITEIADRADATVEDGWYFGQEPRMLKSFYRKIPATKKADFAIAYHEWMQTFKQDLVRDFNSYVPYSKRADFAFNWWSKEEPRFDTQEMKQRVLWAHESVQDANELWWRARDQMRATSSDESDLTMAHDEEQRMLSHFMENRNSPSTISNQIWKRSHNSAENK